MQFVISALRAMLEVFAWCLLGQGALCLFLGKSRAGNPIYAIFAITTAPILRRLARLFPWLSKPGLGMLALLLSFFLWIGLALLRKSL